MSSLSVRAAARAFALAGSLASFGAFAEDAAPQDDTQQVVVVARQNDPEQKPYSALLKAVAMFETFHQRNPDTQLRFRLYARKSGVDMANVTIYVLDSETGNRWPIQLAADGSFTLPDLPAEARRTAVVRTSVPSGLLAWSVRVVRTRGDPRHRPLGDIRQECRMDLDGAHLMRGIMTPAVLALRAAGELCLNRAIWWVDYSEEPVFAVHVKYKGRELGLLSDEMYGGGTPSLYYPALDWPYLLKDRSYRPPIFDASWPDEAEVDLVYVNDQPQQQRVSQQ